MKKLLLSLFVVTSFSAGAQVTIFEDGFENYEDFSITWGDWINVDLDGLGTYSGGMPDPVPPATSVIPNQFDPKAFMIFNPTVANASNANTADGADENRNFDPHTGSKYAACWASSDPDTGAPVNNDWLISPIIQLGASNNELTFWAKSMSDSYGLETYRVYVFPGTGTPAPPTGFTALSGLSNVTAPYPNWELKTYSLNTWSNQSVRIAIRCTSADRYMFMVDDVKVTSSNLSTNDALAAKFSVFPNPANSVVSIYSNDAIAVNQIQITDLNGRVVKANKFDGVSEAQVSVSDLAPGVYMMNITSAEGVAVKKIVRN